MSDKLFLDTNVLVYAYDRSEPRKQPIAGRLIRDGISEESAVVSVQVLGEFFTVITRKIQDPMTAEEARSIIKALSVLPVQEMDLSLAHRAIDAHGRYGLSYWDGLIVAAAERAGCTVICSEDLGAGQAYFGVRVVDPFTSPDAQRAP